MLSAECKKPDLPTRGETKWIPDTTNSPYAYGHNVSLYCDRPGPRWDPLMNCSLLHIYAAAYCNDINFSNMIYLMDDSLA